MRKVVSANSSDLTKMKKRALRARFIELFKRSDVYQTASPVLYLKTPV